MRSAAAVFAAVLVAVLAGTATPAVAGKDPVYTSTFSSVAIRGTDPVAYFTEARPVEGSADHTHEWNGAEWRFASAANRDAFAAEPERYAPRFGGYCAWAVANGYTASTVPEAWSIYDGRLYLNYSLAIRDRWSQDIPGNVRRGDANWPDVLER